MARRRITLDDVPHVRLQTHLARFRRTQNPIHLWRVILICGERGELPSEVRKYLVEVAQRLDSLKQAGDPRAAASAFGFPKGPKRPFDPEGVDNNDTRLAVLFLAPIRRCFRFCRAGPCDRAASRTFQRI